MRTIAVAAGVAFVAKVLIALQTYGTNDVYRYEQFSIWTRYLGIDAYSQIPDLNHPPSVFHLLHAASWLSGVTPLPFPFWLRLPGIVADVMSVWLVTRLLRGRMAEPSISLAVLLFALAPASLMISGFHGNTDPLMIALILLSIYLAQSGRHLWMAGAVFGAATCVKATPLILIPCFLFYFRSVRRIAEFLAAMAGIMIVLWSPYLYQDPRVVLHAVLGYQSLPGQWGISWALIQIGHWIPALTPVAELYVRLATGTLFGLIAVLSLWMNRLPAKRDLFNQCGTIMLVSLALAPGFGVQYLAWILPWVVVLGAPAAGLIYGTSAVFLFAVYNFWAGGLPWYLADSFRAGTWTGLVNLLQFLCWISVVICVWLFFRPFAAPRIRWVHTAVAATAACFIYALSAPHLFRGGDTAGPGVNAIRAAYMVNLSDILLRKGRYPDVISAATAALRLERNLPVAYNNIASADNALGAWDDAIRNSREALRLDPNSALASQNLTHAIKQKDLAATKRGLSP